MDNLEQLVAASVEQHREDRTQSLEDELAKQHLAPASLKASFDELVATHREHLAEINDGRRAVELRQVIARRLNNPRLRPTSL